MNNQITVVAPLWILNQEGLALTKQALDSVEQTQFILVDNASPIGGGYLRSRADIYVRNKENLGFAKAVNQGIKLAKTKYVAVVSNDIRVSANWKEVTMEVFKDPNVYSCHFKMTDYDVPFSFGREISYTGKERWCTAAMFVLDREKALKDDLLFCEDYFNSYEDSDLFTRVWSKGYKTAYTNKVCYQHVHSFTQKLVGFPKTEQNREIFKQKHGEYADTLFEKQFPEQMKVPYWEGFQI